MLSGILAGICWALETIILGAALSMTPFLSSTEAAFLAPFVSTFLHDGCSAVWATLYNLFKGNEKKIFNSLFKTKTGRFIPLAAILGGPIGMTGYVIAVRYMGASMGAVASAVFPAIGSVLACIFLKEKMQWYRWLLLGATLIGVYGLSYSPDMTFSNFIPGLIGTVMCSFGWGTEAVILAGCLKDSSIKDEYILQIRQTTSMLVYGLILLPVLHGWKFTFDLISDRHLLLLVIALAAFFATVSYLFYYKAIAEIGASKAMALDVSYSAWSVVFTVVLLRDFSVLNPLTIFCTADVLICGIFSAADFKELFSKHSRTDRKKESS